MRHKSLSYLITALLALSSSPGSVSAEPPGIRDSEFKELYGRWMDAKEALGVPGFSIVVVRGTDVVLLDGVGTRDLHGDKPVTPDTMFYMASCTKSYVATAVAALAEDGKLDLDAPVQEYLPQFRLADSELSRTLTVRDLLCHRYGLDSDPIVFNDAYSGQITDELYFRLMRDVEPSHEVQYTNVHFTLLGYVIGAVSGKHWRDFLQDRILQPSKMTRTTGYASALYGDENAAQPMIQVDGRLVHSPVRKTNRTMHAAGGMGTTARDLGRWLRIHLNGGKIDGTQIVAPETVAAMQTFNSRFPQTRGRVRQRQGFGLGWFLGKYREDAYTYVDHSGGYIGTGAHISFIPEKEIGVGILANSSPGGPAIADILSIDIYDKVLGLTGRDLLPVYEQHVREFLAQREVPAGPNPAAGGGLSLRVAKYVGHYAHETWGTVSFSLVEGRLIGDYGDLRLELHSTGSDRFTGVASPQLTFDGSFEIQNGLVTALTMSVEGATRRFKREP